jgi:hypothetical protein
VPRRRLRHRLRAGGLRLPFRDRGGGAVGVQPGSDQFRCRARSRRTLIGLRWQRMTREGLIALVGDTERLISQEHMPAGNALLTTQRERVSVAPHSRAQISRRENFPFNLTVGVHIMPACILSRSTE